ncbi:Lyso-phosphatidylcholine acyltransferase [Marasmius tenuissimus]|nr:Lyso-phosphatidylcholine acyltransferase [Marasmius tenuissimus]
MSLSALTVATVGLASKAFFKLGLASVSVSGLQNLSKALESDDRTNGCGIVTVCNHISTLDDPLTWGILPARYYFKSRLTRWTLGASDIMFTNPVFSAFFRKGQVLETFRGKGIYQPAVETAIEKLNKGDWIHLFGEGKVNQPGTYTTDIKGRATLPRFKWGIGRILTSTALPPVVVPMWITGFDKVMPEERPFPFKYLPRIGARLTVSFGDPLPADAVSSLVDRISAAQREEQDPTRKIQLDVLVRTEITAMVHDAVEALGRSRCGDSLTA